MVPCDKGPHVSWTKEWEIVSFKKACKWHYGVNGEILVKKKKWDNLFTVFFAIAEAFLGTVLVSMELSQFEVYSLTDRILGRVFLIFFMVLMMMFIIYILKITIKAQLILKEEHIELKVEKQKYRIAYSDIKEMVLVRRQGCLNLNYKEKGIDMNTIPVGKGWNRFYDVIGRDNQLICSIDVDNLFRKTDFEDKMLYKGVRVKGKKGYFKLKRDILKGEDIECLRNSPVEEVPAKELQQYIELYNQQVLVKNRGFGYFTRKKRPMMELIDTYEAGYVYWTTKVADAVIYCKDGELTRDDIAQYVELNRPKSNGIVYYIKDIEKDVIIIVQESCEKKEEY